MPSLFDASDRSALLMRLDALPAGAVRQWGTMNPAQMLAHCSVGLEAAVGDRPMKQRLIGKLLSWLARGGALGEKPFGRNLPTAPAFVISDARDFAAEKRRLVDLVNLLVARGPSEAARMEHAFFGRLTGEEWGVLMYKHLDHHLRQFGG